MINITPKRRELLQAIDEGRIDYDVFIGFHVAETKRVVDAKVREMVRAGLVSRDYPTAPHRLWPNRAHGRPSCYWEEHRMSNEEAKIGDAVVDDDGDEWVLREDGWCCQSPCDCTGVVARHACEEHDHFSSVMLEAMFGPLVAASPLSDKKGAGNA